jgi:hypothetical protein
MRLTTVWHRFLEQRYSSHLSTSEYEGQGTIIKGIWSSVNSKHVAQEGFYLHDMKMLLALFTNRVVRGDDVFCQHVPL